MFKLQHDDAVTLAQAFDHWVSRHPSLYTAILNLAWGRRLRKALPHIRGPRVLEVSFGTGYLLCQYAGKHEVTGVDLNPLYVDMVRRRLAAQNISANILLGDAQALPFADNSFDTLVNTDAFTLYGDSTRAMSEFYRVLAPGGRMILMEWDYPSNGNFVARAWANLARWMKMPYVAFEPLLRSTGFTFDDYAVGHLGLLHMYVATKPIAAQAELTPSLHVAATANGTSATPTGS